LSFTGQGVDDRSLTATLVQSPAGFYAFIRTPDGMIYMEPSGPGNTRQSISYMRDDLGEQPTFECGVTADDHVSLPGMESAPERGPVGLVAPSGATLHTYRLA